MKTRHYAALGLGLAAVLLVVTSARAGSPPQAPSAQMLQRGKYLTEQVGLCADCHTPRKPDGDLDMAHHLQGSMLMFKPTVPVPGWAPAAPSLVNLSAADIAKTLEVGRKKDGTVPGMPMPAFRFSRQDAAAVGAYISSLRPAAR